MNYRKATLNMPQLKHKYEICETGVVTNLDNGKVLKGTSISKNNRYVKIHLDKFYPLHRLVAECFIPNPKGLPQVNHKDGNRYNNSASNLEWVSCQDNVKHAYRNNLKTNHGEKNPFRKLNKEQVAQIWKLKNTDLTARQIRDRLKLNVSIATVKAIRQGKNWTSVTSKL